MYYYILVIEYLKLKIKKRENSTVPSYTKTHKIFRYKLKTYKKKELNKWRAIPCL